jgi:uncharacterized glyoxalase superfamily protein PhnB
MTTTVKPVPAGFHTVTPYLILKDAGRAIEFYQRAFGATELFRKTPADAGSGIRRSPGLTDPFGHVWYIASRIRNLEA